MRIQYDEATPKFIADLVDAISREQPELWKTWLALEKANESIQDVHGHIAMFIKGRVETKKLRELSDLVMDVRSELHQRIERKLV